MQATACLCVAAAFQTCCLLCACWLAMLQGAARYPRAGTRAPSAHRSGTTQTSSCSRGLVSVTLLLCGMHGAGPSCLLQHASITLDAGMHGDHGAHRAPCCTAAHRSLVSGCSLAFHSSGLRSMQCRLALRSAGQRAWCPPITTCAPSILFRASWAPEAAPAPGRLRKRRWGCKRGSHVVECWLAIECAPPACFPHCSVSCPTPCTAEQVMAGSSCTQRCTSHGLPLSHGAFLFVLFVVLRNRTTATPHCRSCTAACARRRMCAVHLRSG